MAPEPPGERLQRRLGLLPEPDRTEKAAEPGDEADPNSLLPRWLPDATDAGWLAKVRADPGRAGAIALAVIAAVAVLITVFTVVRDRPAPVLSAKLPPVEMVSTASTRGAEPSADPAPVADQVVVSVVGLVHKPGLATLSPGSRIADALTAAGGALDGADTIGLNLARPVVDGEQIVVGLVPPAGPPVLGSSVGAASPPPEAPRSSTAPTATATKPEPKGGEPVNLNTATVEQLDALPGVGPVTAAAIVAWREAHGKFADVDQLGDVDGIGPARLEKLRALVRV
ncbi:membrane protein ComEA [Mycolicibacter sinensis]|uniref:Membrane protein ComEA n=1 Tax=Mycolicibacter sinensis (strain JDM601) TaxID=875328 RepID=F5YZ08_MYCSD|nr:ComEA family DNA-binding protein [Mycolicibacter sinensis]AEF35500.1 membrane protein ComEA [Mycolicibacter sinensis]